MSGTVLLNYRSEDWIDCASFSNPAQPHKSRLNSGHLSQTSLTPDYHNTGYQPSSMSKNVTTSSFNPLEVKSNIHTENMKQLSTVAPKHPQYQTYSSRLDSFVAWPIRYVPKTPEELASAGFFYIGSADRVTCFHCGITLRDWEAEHSPVAEHKRYASDCEFSKLQSCELLGGDKKVQEESGHSSMAVDENANSNVDLHITQTNDLHLGGGACAASVDPNDSAMADPCLVVGGSDDSVDTSALCENLQTLSIEVCDREMPCGSPMDMETTSDITRSHESQKEVSQICKPKALSKKLKLLKAENRRLKEQSTCRVCKNNAVSILFLPCGHLVTCSDCAEKVHECVMCGKTILGTVKTFIMFSGGCTASGSASVLLSSSASIPGSLESPSASALLSPGLYKCQRAKFHIKSAQTKFLREKLSERPLHRVNVQCVGKIGSPTESFAWMKSAGLKRMVIQFELEWHFEGTPKDDAEKLGTDRHASHCELNYIMEHGEIQTDGHSGNVLGDLPGYSTTVPESDSFKGRLETFASKPNIKENRVLAQAGFSYTAPDRVECSHCGLQLHLTGQLDNVLQEHLRSKPNCPSISKLSNTGPRTPPKHPEYREAAARLDSFTSWPTAYVPQSPENLVAAGFYYIGSADRVTCFQCGITLRDWDVGHDPMTEHREYSPNCEFISTPDLNQLGVARRVTSDLDIDAVASASLGNLDLQGDCSGLPGTDGSFDDVELEVREMGFPADKIRRAKDVFLRRHGRSCENTSELVDCILTLGNDKSNNEEKLTTKIPFIVSNCQSSFRDEGPVSSPVKEMVNSDSGIKPPKSPKSKVKNAPLLSENKRLREQRLCRVCRQRDVCTLFLPCGHLVTCESCAEKVDDCVLCNRTIMGTVKTYLT
ncbi:baculoviral IAP repeat-containing protein 2-like [Haliotis rufescens]|uniref:baculoviral IAP repeat-containing protein 2-like n=1 Tax=Haliotis rufescens TaxID=6454 RepID=UPI00201F78CC|nr:baculoviral IAP repeat-containing protein 2-like [Haliotis rufescens]